MIRVKQQFIQNIFKNSKILKTQVDRAILYFNLPENLHSNLIIPTRLFPQEDVKENHPNLSKIIHYFETKSKIEIPSIFLFEIELKVDGRI